MEEALTWKDKPTKLELDFSMFLSFILKVLNDNIFKMFSFANWFKILNF